MSVMSFVAVSIFLDPFFPVKKNKRKKLRKKKKKKKKRKKPFSFMKISHQCIKSEAWVLLKKKKKKKKKYY